MASRTKYDDKHPESWLETTINYLVDRCHGTEPLFAWVAWHQPTKVEPRGMHSSEALSKNLWCYLNLARSGTTQAKEFLKFKRLNGQEAWRRIVVPPFGPRSEAKRNALHTSVHNSRKSKSLATVIGDMDEWEKTVE